MDNSSLNDIINSILSSVPNYKTPQNNEEEGSIQYLLPVDLLVSVNKKSNVKKIEAAIPSSFAWNPQHIIPASPSYPTSYPPFYQQTKSTLNPSAASFTPSIAEYPNEQSTEDMDPWNALNAMPNSTKMKKISLKSKAFKARSHRFNDQHRAYNQNWRNQSRFIEKSEYKSKRLLAEFVSHVTLQNREEVKPNTVYTKTWKMRNCGETAWGFDVELVYCKGDEFLSLYDRYPVINAEPDQEIEICATIKTAKKAGRYCTYFRLMKNEKYFGPRVWCDVVVSNGMDRKRIKCSVEAGREQNEKKENMGKWRMRNKKYGVVSCK